MLMIDVFTCVMCIIIVVFTYVVAIMMFDVFEYVDVLMCCVDRLI